MKFLLLFLLSFNAYAELELTIIPNDAQYARGRIDGADQAEIDSNLLEFTVKQKFFTGEWNKVETDSILSKVEMEETFYYHPLNYSTSLENVTVKKAEERVKADRKKELKESAKTKDLTSKELNEYLFQ